jgi:hypothetical protein
MLFEEGMMMMEAIKLAAVPVMLAVSAFAILLIYKSTRPKYVGPHEKAKFAHTPFGGYRLNSWHWSRK